MPAIYNQWAAYRLYGVLPCSGGWNDQPLQTLTQIQAIETVYGAYEHNKREGSKFEDMTATQQQVYLWLEKELQDG